jgi:hypothetical protein
MSLPSANIFVRLDTIEASIDRLAARLDRFEQARQARPVETIDAAVPRRGRGLPPGSRNRPKGDDTGVKR